MIKVIENSCSSGSFQLPPKCENYPIYDHIPCNYTTICSFTTHFLINNDNNILKSTKRRAYKTHETYTRVPQCKKQDKQNPKKIPSLSYNLTNLHNLPRTWAHPSNPLSPTPTNYLKKGI